MYEEFEVLVLLSQLNQLLQVTCEYYMSQGACVPLRVHTVVVSVQHSEKISLEDLRADVMAKVIRVVIPEKYLDEKTTFHINPCGLFVVGGPQVSGGMLSPFAHSVLYGCSF